MVQGEKKKKMFLESEGAAANGEIAQHPYVQPFDFVGFSRLGDAPVKFVQRIGNRICERHVRSRELFRPIEIHADVHTRFNLRDNFAARCGERGRGRLDSSIGGDRSEIRLKPKTIRTMRSPRSRNLQLTQSIDSDRIMALESKSFDSSPTYFSLSVSFSP